MSSSVKTKHLTGLTTLAKEKPHSLNVISLEQNKRIVSTDNLKITIWPVRLFLDELWSGKIWT